MTISLSVLYETQGWAHLAEVQKRRAKVDAAGGCGLVLDTLQRLNDACRGVPVILALRLAQPRRRRGIWAHGAAEHTPGAPCGPGLSGAAPTDYQTIVTRGGYRPSALTLTMRCSALEHLPS